MGKHSAPSSTRGRGRTFLIVIIAAAVVIVGVVAALALRDGKADVIGEVRTGEEISVEVPVGSTTTSIGELLVDEGVIPSLNAFVSRVEELGCDGSLQAGSYEFTGGDNLDAIIEALANGRTVGLTVPEGYTLTQIAERVGECTDLDVDEFYELVSTGAADYVDDYPFLENAYEGTMEGFLFPATYEVSSDLTAGGLVRQMLDAYAAQFESIDMEYAASKNLDEYDVVTLASIIEKESRTDDDKADIASVFYNRLKAGMTLGSDVTTYYAVGKDLTEDLTSEDLASDSPYNTRNPNNYGLPAGPICSPGIAALDAAANPSDTDYLYFFWSESEGKTMFFETAEEFSAAWDEYGE